MINGIINVYKEAGFTSHDVVAKLRGILKQKKIGHTGTLDPDAEGVLPVCLGSATRLCDMITDRSKEYVTVMKLGVTTDTEDSSGTILTEKPVNLTEKDITEAVNSFCGGYEQIPPMYSAIKVNGKKLYELARQGEVIERKARKIEITSIEILSIDLPFVKMKINCGKGTYIRSLCRDIGEKLGCGACMDSLVRTRVGMYKLEDACKISEIEELAANGQIDNHVNHVESFFEEYSPVTVEGRNAMLVKNGNMFKNDSYEGEMIRVYRIDGAERIFAGIYYYETENEVYKPYKMFQN